ncbi:MAG: hypothetical protein WC340_05545 [Kiritimatiellia bacterium]|jgi:hypothetical protein
MKNTGPELIAAVTGSRMKNSTLKDVFKYASQLLKNFYKTNTSAYNTPISIANRKFTRKLMFCS